MIASFLDPLVLTILAGFAVIVAVGYFTIRDGKK